MEDITLTKEEREKVDNQFYNFIDKRLCFFKYEFLDGGLYEGLLSRDLEFEILTTLLSSDDRILGLDEGDGDYKLRFIHEVESRDIDKSYTLRVNKDDLFIVTMYLEQFELVEGEDIIVEMDSSGEEVMYEISIDYTNNFPLIYELVGRDGISSWKHYYRCLEGVVSIFF